MDAALRESTFEALGTDWILDADVTVKLLFGHQDGAEIGYNPSKPGRPSHNIHTYWIANLRLVESSGSHRIVIARNMPTRQTMQINIIDCHATLAMTTFTARAVIARQ